MQVRAKQFEAAHETLKPLMRQKKFHTTEFAALCNAQIALSVAEKQPGNARRWVELWEGVDADNPQLLAWKARLDATDVGKLLGKLFRR
jgi:hypothetical protein